MGSQKNRIQMVLFEHPNKTNAKTDGFESIQNVTLKLFAYLDTESDTHNSTDQTTHLSKFAF